MKIYEFTDKWLLRKKGYVRDSTLINYLYAIKRFKKYFENSELTDISREIVLEKFLVMCKDGCSRSSIYNVRQVMGAVYGIAQEQGIVCCNPFKKAKIPEQAPEKIVEAYSLEEQSRLVKAASEDMLGDLYIFLILTGLRKSEFLNLKWGDYNKHCHTLNITKSKTRSGVRKIMLSPKAESILLRQPRYNHEYIFSTSKGNRASVTSLKKLCRRLEMEVGFHVTCHRARHTFCTRLVCDAEADPKTVCSLSGHSSVAFLMQRYVTSDFKKQRQALSLLDEIVT